jgi:lipopolysaccharide/colanic/teichoic acid biosynthesis glycosyltransferase
MMKRLFDIAVSAVILFVTAPFIALGALAVKLTSPGPMFYRARRAGIHGEPFEMLKLRTMRVGTATPDRKITDQEDDRLTSAGRVLRRFKIDELPQFWNVLRGDMSIVGPRPEDWDIVQQYYTADQRHILDVCPGIASPVDVRWYPDLTYHDPPPIGVSMQEHYLERHLPLQVAEGLRYVEHRSMWLDIKVLVRIAFCVVVHSLLPPKKQPVTLDSSAVVQVARLRRSSS